MRDSENEYTIRSAVERRAYEIYLQRGSRDGHDIEDWLMAEREISRTFDPRASEVPASRAVTVGRSIKDQR